MLRPLVKYGSQRRPMLPLRQFQERTLLGLPLVEISQHRVQISLRKSFGWSDPGRRTEQAEVRFGAGAMTTSRGAPVEQDRLHDGGKLFHRSGWQCLDRLVE